MKVMPVKLLKGGEDYEGSVDGWKRKVICRTKKKDLTYGCGAELEIKADDLISVYWHEGRFFWKAVVDGIAFRCPECGQYNVLDQIPINIRYHLRSRGGRCSVEL
jgi:hypothetical protein